MEQLTKLHEIKVSYKRTGAKDSITSSANAYEISKEICSLSEACISLREYFYIILLNRANKIIGFYQLSSGGISGTVADPRLAFSIALKCLASGMILFHNHPSGSLKASEADIVLTKKFKTAGSLLDINILDHLIITENEYYSFADEGLL
jgi:DNA repair protein RadC